MTNPNRIQGPEFRLPILVGELLLGFYEPCRAVFDVMFDGSKNSHFREQHWPAIFGGISEHLYGKSPFRRLALGHWQHLDVIGGVAQRAGRRAARKRNGLVEWTIPRHSLH